MPQRTPAFSDVLVGAGRQIWVSSYEFDRSTGFDWLVCSSTGELRGLVRTSPGFRVMDIGDGYPMGVVLDELDVPYVRRYPFVLSFEAQDG